MNLEKGNDINDWDVLEIYGVTTSYPRLLLIYIYIYSKNGHLA